MNNNAACFLTWAIGTTLVFSAASSSAATLFPFYLTGGLASWSSGIPGAIPMSQNTSASSPTSSISSSTERTSFRLSAGYSFDETWSIEASYINGPSRNVASSGVHMSSLGSTFEIDYRAKDEMSILRFNPVYEYTLVRPFSMQLKVGIAITQREQTSYTNSRPIGAGGSWVASPPTSRSTRDARLFASTGFKLNFREGTIAAVVSSIRYYKPVGGVRQSLELDLLWRF